ncbi:TPA: hypothetical protein ACNRIA_005077, partial [Escherichia coli]
PCLSIQNISGSLLFTSFRKDNTVLWSSSTVLTREGQSGNLLLAAGSRSKTVFFLNDTGFLQIIKSKGWQTRTTEHTASIRHLRQIETEEY